MKRYILLVIFVVIYSQISAQQQQWNKSIYFQEGRIIGKGFNIETGYEKLFGKNLNSALVSLSYMKLDNIVSAVPVSYDENNISLNLSYRRYFYINNARKLYPFIGLGVLGGYSHTGGGDNGIFHLNENESFLCGVTSHTGIEYNLGRVSFFALGSYMYSGDHYFMADIGMKFYF